MKMNEGVEWAAHCAVLLAALPAGATLPAARLAEYHDVPAPYLAKSLQALMRAGIVDAVTGRFGGYRLARPPAEITMLDIVQAIDGTDPMFRCTELRRRGPTKVAQRLYGPRCGIAAAMGQAEEAWQEELRQTTVADIARHVVGEAPPTALEKGMLWLSDVLSIRSSSSRPAGS
jgi:Rrf2 family protein